MLTLKNVCATLNLDCCFDEQVLSDLKSNGRTDDEIAKDLFESNESKIEYNLKVSLHCLQRDYDYLIEVSKIDINYPTATITFDVEINEDDYETIRESKDMFVSSFTRTLTHEPYQIYTIYGKRNNLTMMLVSVEVLDVHI